MSKPAVSRVTPNLKAQNQAPLALVIENITVTYKNKIALKDLKGQVRVGSLTAVVGPNGGGKSTFLKALLGLVPLSQGKIQFGFASKSAIAYLPQQCDIDQTFPLTVRDVVASGLYQRQGFFKRIERDALIQVKLALEQVGMLECANHPLNVLSGGQFQRVLFARLIVQNADIILLDEPFTAVDSYTVANLVNTIRTWQQQKKTIIIVCHDFELVREHFPETILLAQQILAWGPTHEVLTLKNLRTAKNIAQSLERCDIFCNFTQPYELKL